MFRKWFKEILNELIEQIVVIEIKNTIAVNQII